MDFKNDVELIKVCSLKINESESLISYRRTLDLVQSIISEIKNEEEQCKIFKLRDMHQIKASIYLLLG